MRRAAERTATLQRQLARARRRHAKARAHDEREGWAETKEEEPPALVSESDSSSSDDEYDPALFDTTDSEDDAGNDTHQERSGHKEATGEAPREAGAAPPPPAQPRARAKREAALRIKCEPAPATGAANAGYAPPARVPAVGRVDDHATRSESPREQEAALHVQPVAAGMAGIGAMIKTGQKYRPCGS